MKLTKKEQEVYNLRKEGKTFEECAELLGRTTKSIKETERLIKEAISNLHFCFGLFNNGVEVLVHVITDKGYHFALSKAAERASESVNRSVDDKELFLHSIKDMWGDNVDYDCSRTFKCCICGEEHTGYGNNPNPVMTSGECCDKCNKSIVIPTRIKECLKETL